MTAHLLKASLATITASFLVIAPKQVTASHARAMDINYEHISGETYRITLNFYRDCAGTTAPASATLKISSVICGFTQTLALPLDTFFEVSQLCPSELPNSRCKPGGTLPGVQKYVYSALYTFPQKCSDWVLSFDLCCRNAAITNLTSPGSHDQYIYATLNNTGTINNNSPAFLTLPTPYVCANQPMTFNPGGSDPDGDSLVYQLAQPMDNPGSTIPYNSPFTISYPLSTASGTVTFNPANGQINCTPNAQQVAVIALLVKEYRAGVLIANYYRDFQVIVRLCDNDQPVISNIQSVTGGTFLDSVTVQACTGVPMCMTIVVTDSNAGTLAVTSNAPSILPGATVSTTGNNPVTVSICWTTLGNSLTSYSFIVTAEDDTCPIPGVASKMFHVILSPATYAGPDQHVCGDSAQLLVTGGTAFTWAPPTGLSCTNCPNPKALPSATTTYTVTSNLVSSCDSIDSVTVFVALPFTMDAGPPDTICAGEATYLAPTYDSGSYLFSWSPSTDLSDPNIATPLAFPSATTIYTLTMTNTVTKCVMQDIVQIVVNGTGSTAFPYADDDSLCAGESAQLDLEFGCYGYCQTETIGCSSPILATVGLENNVPGPIDYPAPFGKFYYDAHHQFLFTSSELIAAGLPRGGKVSSIAFQVQSTTGTPTYYGYTVKMKCTTQDEFTGTSPDYSGLKTVFTPKTYNVVVGWNTITFDSLYDWNGYDNILVDICFDNNANQGANDRAYYTPTTTYRSLYRVNTTCGTTATHVRSFNRPNTRLKICCDTSGTGMTYAWMPQSGLSNPNIRNPVATPTSTTTYTVFATNSTGTCSSFGMVTVHVSPDFTLSSIPDTTICRGGEVQLYTTPSPPGTDYKYSWTPPYQLSEVDIPNPVARPLVSTSYIVTVDHNDCDNYDTVNVTVLAGMGLVQAFPEDTTICRDASVQLIAKAAPQPAVCGVDTTDCGTGPALETTVGSGYLVGEDCTPFQWHEKRRSQYIYRSEDLWQAGIYGGTIKDIAVYVPSILGSLNNYLNLSVKIGCVSVQEFGAPPSWVGGLTQVYTTSVYAAAVGWNVFPFSSPFNWNGQSNLVIEVCYDDVTNHSGQTRVFQHVTSYYCTQFQEAVMPTTWNGCTIPAPGTRLKERPNMRFNVCSPPGGNYTYSWNPPTWLSNPNIANPVATSLATTTYTLTIGDATCDLTAPTVHIVVDSFGLSAGPDTTICPAPADSIQLWANIGYVPAMELDCGTNATTCDSMWNFYQFGSGITGLIQTSPFYTWGPGNNTCKRAQYIITADELRAAGREDDGIIMQVELEFPANTPASVFDGISIYMGCTTMSQFESASFIPLLTLVKTVPSNYVPQPGWNVFVLDNPFDWDGVSNLVIEFCNDSITTVNYQTWIVGTSTPNSYMSVGAFQTLPTCGLAGVGTATVFREQYRPNISLGFCNPPTATVTYQWSPGSTLSDSTIANPKSGATDTTTYTLTAFAGKCIVQEQVTLEICETLLPISWMSFDAWPVEEHAQLQWTVAPWPTTSHFVVERAIPGGTFSSIGIVKASPTRSTYSLADNDPFRPSNYYRIRHVDQSGGYDYSVVRTVEFFGQEISAALFPNPLGNNDDLTLSIIGLENGEDVYVKVLNALGAELFAATYEASAFLAGVQLEGKQFTSGAVYIVRVEAEGRVINLKLLRE